jgi:hypothetical protein
VESCGKAMSSGEDRAREFVADVKSGVSDLVLQQKYALRRSKFFLYKASALDIIAKEKNREFRQKRKINLCRVLSDVGSGMDDEALMVKYALNLRELQSVLRQIIETGLASPLELCCRLSITESQVLDALVEMGKAGREFD